LLTLPVLIFLPIGHLGLLFSLCSPRCGS